MDAKASDSCARLTLYCSVSFNEYDISCGLIVFASTVSRESRWANMCCPDGRMDSVRVGSKAVGSKAVAPATSKDDQASEHGGAANKRKSCA